MKVGSKKFLIYATVLMASALSALNYTIFVFPNRFAPAGLNGLCTLLQYAAHIPVSIMSLLINLPLAFWVYRSVNKPVALRSLVFTAGFSLFLTVWGAIDLSAFEYSTANGTSKVLGPLVAGVINGFVYSLIVRAGSYTGGLDYVAALIHKKRPEANFFGLTFIMNAMVAAISYFVYDFEIEPVILCILFCFLTSSVSDFILKNNKSAVKLEIVTKHPKAISQELIQHLHHSVTRMEGLGMYSGHDTYVLICVINRRQVPEFERIIHKYPGSFAYLSPVKEVVGNFKHVDKNGHPEKPLLAENPEDPS